MTAYAPGLSAKEVQALDAANLYYAGLTQQEVAQRLHVSRPAVSKLLAYAYLHLQGHVFQTRFLGKEFPVATRWILHNPDLEGGLLRPSGHLPARGIHRRPRGGRPHHARGGREPVLHCDHGTQGELTWQPIAPTS